MLPCSKTKNYENWKYGERFIDDTIPSMKFERNIFDCGIYFFDGIFNVVKFPKGINLYHGSSILADNLIEFPTGIDFYSNKNSKKAVKLSEVIIAETQEEIESIISDNYNITASWFGDPRVAASYSNIGSSNKIPSKEYIMAYELKSEAIFYLLDDDYNIAKLLYSDTSIVPDDIKETLRKMFSLTEKSVPEILDNRPFTRILYKDKLRISYRNTDKYFAEWFCKNIISMHNYAGYGATTQKASTILHKEGKFHQEIILCNAFKWLKRNLANNYDWQFANIRYDTFMGKLYSEYSNYKSTNINFHSGNLLEHAVWSLLWAEDIVNSEPFNNILTEKQKKLTCFISYIHDIGKMQPDSSENIKREMNNIYYFAIKDHPLVGSEYVSGKKDIKLVDGTQINIKKDILSMLSDIGLDKSYLYIVELVLLYHTHIGIVISSSNNDFQKIKKEMTKFIDTLPKFNTEEEFRIFIIILLVVSLADMYATQPYGVQRLNTNDTVQSILNGNSGINACSRYFPDICNLPKKYAGRNIAKDLNLDNLILKLLSFLLRQEKITDLSPAIFTDTEF